MGITGSQSLLLPILQNPNEVYMFRVFCQEHPWLYCVFYFGDHDEVAPRETVASERISRLINQPINRPTYLITGSWPEHATNDTLEPSKLAALHHTNSTSSGRHDKGPRAITLTETNIKPQSRTMKVERCTRWLSIGTIYLFSPGIVRYECIIFRRTSNPLAFWRACGHKGSSRHLHG